MDHRDDRPDHNLPVTAEVGGEGGSYADATAQAETFTGPEGNPRVDQRAAGIGADAPAVRSGQDSSGPEDDVVTYPTERPKGD